MIGLLFSFLVLAHSADPSVSVAEIRAPITPATVSYLRHVVDQANTNPATALIIVELDTPGGLVSSAREMVQTIDQSRIPVVVFVTPAGAAATSAGAILMMASHLGAMSPGSNMGAAHPVGAGGEDVKGVMGEKVTADVAAMVRGLAELRRRPVNLAEEMVTKSRSFSASQAYEMKLVEIIASDRTDLLRQLEGRVVSGKALALSRAAIDVRAMSLGERLLTIVAHPNVAAILMTLAMLLIYFELAAPGLSIAGILGGLCLILGLMAAQALSVQTGGLVLLGLGLVLIAAELFSPSHGLLGFSGVGAFVLGLAWAFDHEASDLKLSRVLLVGLGVGLGSTSFFVLWATARTKRLVEKARAVAGGGGISGLLGYTGTVYSVQQEGTKWVGKAQFRGELWDFESAEMVQAGDHVVARAVEGFRVEVTRTEAPGNQGS